MKFWVQGWWSEDLSEAIATAERIGGGTIWESEDGLTPTTAILTIEAA